MRAPAPSTRRPRFRFAVPLGLALPLGLAATLPAVPGAFPATTAYATPAPVSDKAAERVARGREALSDRDYRRAVREFKAAIGQDEANAEAHAGLIRAERERGKAEKAREAAAEALEALPGATPVLVEAALTEHALENWSRARDLADEALKDPEVAAVAWRVKADAVAALAPGDPVELGVKVFADALEKRGESVDVRAELADFYADWGRSEEAILCYRKALEQAGERTDLWVRLARLHLGTGDTEAGRDAAQKAIDIDPAYAPAQAALGRAYEEEGQPEAATAFYAEAVKLRPKDPRYRVDHGYILALTQQWDEAEDELRDALALDDENTEAWLHLGLVHDRQGKAKDALKDYDRVLRLDPENVEALFYAADLQGVLGKTRDAEKSLDRVLAIDPEHPEAWRLLAKLAMDSGKLDLARERVDAALEFDPENPRARLLSARLFEEIEDWDAAEKAYTEALKKHAGDMWLQIYWAELADEVLDKPEDAIKAYKAYLDLGGPDPDGEIERRIEALEEE